MFYFKFITQDGEELYGNINAPKTAIDLEVLEKILETNKITEVTEEEYEAETETDESDES